LSGASQKEPPEAPRRAWHTTYPVTKFHGVHQEGKTAHAYYVMEKKGKSEATSATILYLTDKGWYLKDVNYGLGYGWSDIFIKVARVKK
jgi:hypothetical protein